MDTAAWRCGGVEYAGRARGARQVRRLWGRGGEVGRGVVRGGAGRQGWTHLLILAADGDDLPLIRKLGSEARRGRLYDLAQRPNAVASADDEYGALVRLETQRARTLRRRLPRRR